MKHMTGVPCAQRLHCDQLIHSLEHAAHGGSHLPVLPCLGPMASARNRRDDQRYVGAHCHYSSEGPCNEPKRQHRAERVDKGQSLVPLSCVRTYTPQILLPCNLLRHTHHREEAHDESHKSMKEPI